MPSAKPSDSGDASRATAAGKGDEVLPGTPQSPERVRPQGSNRRMRLGTPIAHEAFVIPCLTFFEDLT